MRPQVCAVAHRADSWLAIDFLNAHGVGVTFPDIAPPPDPSEWHTQEMSDVLYAFTRVDPAPESHPLTSILFSRLPKQRNVDLTSWYPSLLGVAADP